MKYNPVHRLLGVILKVQTAHPLLIFLFALALATISVFYTVRNLEFETSQKDLIYPTNRLMQLSERLDQFDDLDSFVVVIQSDDRHRSLQFLQALVPRLERDRTHYHEIFFRVDPRQFKSWALLYLDREELLTLSDNVAEHHEFLQKLAQAPKLTEFFMQMNYEMTSKMVGEFFTGYLDEGPQGASKEPVDLDFLVRVLREMKRALDGSSGFVSPWDSLFTKEFRGKDSDEGYFWTKDKRYLLLFISPDDRADFTRTMKPLAALRNAIDQTLTQFPDVKAGVTGQKALNADQMGTAFDDMRIATLLSIGLLAVLLTVFWRGIRLPLLEMTRLLIDLALTFGATTLFIGHLNILSITFAPLNLGLGIDYGAHWVARYQEEKKRGVASKRDAIRTIMEKLGPGLLLAGLNASLSFFPLVLTGFKGLVELGIICAMGMIITTLTSLCLLPALILLFDRPGRTTSSPSSSPDPVRPFFNLTRPRVFAILTLSGIALFFGAWGAGKVQFDMNMLNLQSPKVESVVWEKKLLDNSGVSSMSGAIMARSLDEVRQKKNALESLPTVSRVQSVSDLLPEDQDDKIGILRKLKPFLRGMPAFQGTDHSVKLEELEGTLGKIRFKMSDVGSSEWGVSKPLETQMVQVRTLIDHVLKRIHSMDGQRARKTLGTFEKDLMQDLNEKLDILRTNVHSEPMVVEDLPQSLRDRFVGRNGLYLIRVYPSEDIWEPDFLGRFVRDLQSVDPDVTGDPVTLFIFTQAFCDGCIKAALYALAFIFLFLLFTFRSFKTTLLALTPLLAGTLWTLGLMHLFRIDLNLANSLFLPLVVGAGVEYGIIVMHRWRQRDKGADVILPFSTAMGVTLAGLTTTVGFGSLCISSHQGIFSLGLLTTIGSLCIVAAAILLLPAVLHFLKSRM